MGAALSIVTLFAISSTIVRVAAVFLEHTGLSRDIARMQAMSALSGTGFTTSESELILQTPERRRILSLLIVAGSIGLASVVATLVLGAFGIEETARGIVLQLAAIGLAVTFVRYILFSQAVDDFVCGLAYAWLDKRMAHVSYTILYHLGAGEFLAEHYIAGAPLAPSDDWPEGLFVVGVRDHVGAARQEWDRAPLPAGSTILLIGSRQAHDAFAKRFGVARPIAGHQTHG